MSALSDLYKLFQEAVSASVTETSNSNKRKVEFGSKKIYFFLVWANEQPDEKLVELKDGVIEQWEAQKQLINQTTQSRNTVGSVTPAKTSKPTKPLIQEIN